MSINDRFNSQGFQGPNITPQFGPEGTSKDSKKHTRISNLIQRFENREAQEGGTFPKSLNARKATQLPPDPKTPMPKQSVPPGELSRPSKTPKGPREMYKSNDVGIEEKQAYRTKALPPIPSKPAVPPKPEILQKPPVPPKPPVHPKPQMRENPSFASKPPIAPKPVNITKENNNKSQKDIKSDSIDQSSRIPINEDQESVMRNRVKLKAAIMEFDSSLKDVRSRIQFACETINLLFPEDISLLNPEEQTVRNNFLQYFSEEEKKQLESLKGPLKSFLNFCDTIRNGITIDIHIKVEDAGDFDNFIKGAFQTIAATQFNFEKLATEVFAINSFAKVIGRKSLNANFKNSMSELYIGMLGKKEAGKAFLQNEQLGLPNVFRSCSRIELPLKEVLKNMPEKSAYRSSVLSFRESMTSLIQKTDELDRASVIQEELKVFIRNTEILVEQLKSQPKMKLKLKNNELVISGGKSLVRSISSGGVDALDNIFNKMIGFDRKADELIENRNKKLYLAIKALPQMKSEMEHPKVKALIEELDKRFAPLSDADQDKRHSTTSISGNKTGV